VSLPQLELDNQICFLVYRLEHRIKGLYRGLLEPLGVTYPQYLVLLVLWESRETGVGDLANRLDLDSGTISPLLKRMERMGLVRRARSRSDERAVRVSLTSRGRAMEKQAAAIPAALASCLGQGSGVDAGRLSKDLRSILAGGRPHEELPLHRREPYGAPGHLRVSGRLRPASRRGSPHHPRLLPADPS
jgi:MarR family transcriptional regulator, organic hydroperoxide resistance regulator